MNILIVEDSKTLQAIMQRYILKLGHEPLLAMSGEMAVQMVDQQKIDMVIMDVEMPGLNGYETTQLIRENLGDEWIPIIFVTGMAEDQSLADGIEAGGDDYLIKPISEVILNAKIRAMERIADMRTQLRELNEQLTQLSQHDSLTGLYNRRVFEEKAEIAWQRTARTAEPLTLLLLDIDHFKAYNDYYGHVEGDECIRKVAHALSAAFNRSCDVIARYGGEEFICLLPNTDKQGAKHVGEQLRKLIRDLRIEHRASNTDKYVTLSVGANVIRYTTGISLEDQITLADKALYESKRTGRNRVSVTEFENLNTLLLVDNSKDVSQTCEYLSGHCKLIHFDSLKDAASRNLSTPELIILNADCEELVADFKAFCDTYNLNLTPVVILSTDAKSWKKEEHEEIQTIEVIELPVSKHHLVSRIDHILGLSDAG